MECEKCGGIRVLQISAKCNDLCSLTFKGVEHNDYVPSDLRIGGEDYITVDICLDCGMAQGCVNTEDPQFYTDRDDMVDEDEIYPVTESDDLFDQDVLTDRKCPKCDAFLISHPDCTTTCSFNRCDYVERYF